MIENIESTRELWRKRIYRYDVIMAMVIFIVEVAIDYVMNMEGLIEMPFVKHLFLYAILPSICNILALILAKIVCKIFPNNINVQNAAGIFCFTVISSVIAWVHYVFSATLVGFIVPIFLSVVFFDRILCNSVFVLSTIGYTLAAVHRYMVTPQPAEDGLFVPDVLVAYFIICVAWRTAMMVIRILNEHRDALNDANSKLKYASQRDYLTGLYNRQTLAEVAESMLAKCLEHKKNFTAIMCDLDFFKEINDTYGHASGDVCLVGATQAISKELQGGGGAPKNDAKMFRYGGEEFLILMIGYDAEKSLDIAEKLRKCVEMATYDVQEITVTMSVGVCTVIPASDTKVYDVIKKADQMMYKAKENGRNKVCI